MIRPAGLAGAALAMVLATGAHARTVDYEQLEATLEETATDLEVDPATPMPGPGGLDFVLEGAESADHATRFLAIMCSGHDVDNPASRIIRRVLTEMDRDHDLAEPSGPAVRIELGGVASLMRCFYRGDDDARCIARATLQATARLAGADGDVREVPLSVRVEKTIDSDGFCGGVAQGVGFITREATIQLFGQLAGALQTPVTSVPAAPLAPTQ